MRQRRYAFTDVLLLLKALGEYEAFQDMPITLFYSDTYVTVAGTPLPGINVVVSLASFAILANYMRVDNLPTLKLEAPFELLAWAEPSAVRRDPRAAVWQLVTLPATLWAWCVRGVLVPATVCVGVAQAFAGAHHAAEIVLDSVGVAFIFELDELFYNTWLGARRRATFEVTGEEAAASETHELKVAIRTWCCLLAITDFFSMVSPFVITLQDLAWEATQVRTETATTRLFAWQGISYAVRNTIYLRGSVLGAAHIHLALMRRGHPLRSLPRRPAVALRVLLQACLVLCACLVAFIIHQDLLERCYGARSSPLDLFALSQSGTLGGTSGADSLVTIEGCLEDEDNCYALPFEEGALDYLADLLDEQGAGFYHSRVPVVGELASAEDVAALDEQMPGGNSTMIMPPAPPRTPSMPSGAVDGLEAGASPAAPTAAEDMPPADADAGGPPP